MQERPKMGFFILLFACFMLGALPFAFSQVKNQEKTEGLTKNSAQEIEETDPAQEEAQEEQSKTKEVTGKIVSINVENSLITIRQFKDKTDKGNEEVALHTVKATRIEKAGKRVDLSELKAGDSATGGYTTDEDGKNTANYINYIWVSEKLPGH